MIFCGAILVSAGSADARLVPGLDRVGSDEGEVYWKGCMVGDAQVKSRACRFGDRSSRRKVVLLGDSHAAQWGPGLFRLARKNNWQVIVLTRASCTAAQVNIDYYCDTWRHNSLKRIRKIRPGLVVVASAANDRAYSVLQNGYRLSRSSSESLLLDGMVRTLQKLERWSKRTVVIRDQSVAPFSVTDCLRKHRSRPNRCGFRSQRSKRWSYDFKASRKVQGVRVIDPQPLLCPGRWCHAVDGKHLIYRTPSHLAASFTRNQHEWLDRKLGDPWPAKVQVPVDDLPRPLVEPVWPEYAAFEIDLPAP